MIADTTFLIHLIRERRRQLVGPARSFLALHRSQPAVRTSIISLAEVAVSFAQAEEAWQYFQRWTVYRLHDGIARETAELDREMRTLGVRLGENDTWIGGFCRYYREPVVSRDEAFDRVPNLRRISY